MALVAAPAMAQNSISDLQRKFATLLQKNVPDSTDQAQEALVIGPTDTITYVPLTVEEMIENPPVVVDTMIVVEPLSPLVFTPPVYTNFRYFNDFKPFEREYGDNADMHWVERANARSRNEQMILQRFMINHPEMVPYNIATLPEAPKQYIAEVNPKDHTIEIQEVKVETPDVLSYDIQKRHWLRTFNSSLHFSQAYVSPNWYQGGNNNLNMLVNLYYNVKLNQVYHPKILFETTFQYKLGLNNAPDDSLRNYSISEDLLQINTTFGYKAAKRWYYSVTALFKTQIFNSYVKNSRSLSSAFLSPGEFSAGLGMTYNYQNKKKTFSFDASISPLSYNMKICTRSNEDLAHSAFDIDADKTFAMKYGSSAECKMTWQMARNIQFRSRLYLFTDYGYFQGDWENTLQMDINRFLSTQIYAHLRYDSTTPRTDDPHWHKLQVKEILSFGVSYKFSSI